MATVKKRSSGGGRKPKEIPNPFVINGENMLIGTEECVDIRLEDILVGVIRSYNSEYGNGKQDYVSYNKLIRVYRNVEPLTKPAIEQYLECSDRQAKRYVQVIKTCNIFVERHYKHPATNIVGYVEVTRQQLDDGYWELL